MPVAQLDRAPGYGPGGRGFKSSRARSKWAEDIFPLPALHFTSFRTREMEGNCMRERSHRPTNREHSIGFSKSDCFKSVEVDAAWEHRSVDR